MFIELTDHLRCPAPHEEAFLVLVPYEMDGRMVGRGVLGCPICQREFRINRGVAVFELNGRTGDAAPALTDSIPADAIVAFLGLEGPGGYLGLFGGASGLAASLETALPGVHLVALNPPDGVDRVPAIREPSPWTDGTDQVPVAAWGGAGRDIGSNPEWQKEAAGASCPDSESSARELRRDCRNWSRWAKQDGWWVSRKG